MSALALPPPTPGALRIVGIVLATLGSLAWYHTATDDVQGRQLALGVVGIGGVTWLVNR